MARLSLRGVTKNFGVAPAVSGLSLDVEDGELLVLVGPSGCGKTTTLRMIAGLEYADEGEILIDDRPITAVAPSDRDVAMVFQSYALFPHMTVFDNLAFGPSARHRPPEEIKRVVGEVATALRLGNLLDRKPRQLSGGERQRVALGRALVRRPAVFLMDEPLSNLDAQLRVQTRAEIARFQAYFRATIVYVTHDQIEALSLGHRVGVLRDGVLQQLGTPRDVYERPANIFVASFIGTPAMNIVPLTRVGSSRLLWRKTNVPLGPKERKLVREHEGDVVLGLRPEHMAISRGRAAAGAFDAVVEVVEAAGDRTYLVLRADDQSLTARVEPVFAGEPGERVKVSFDQTNIHLFDAATERAIAHARIGR